MAITIPTFRQQFPEFSDPVTYSDVVIQVWDTVALSLLDPTRWGTLLVYGESLFVAHHLVIGARDLNTAIAGGTPGGVQGPTASKAVDKVSVSYDTAAASLEDGAFWNSTRYGIQFLTLARQIGMGGNQF